MAHSNPYSQTRKPVFLFAFAQSADGAHLSQLREEERQVREALQEARDAGRIDYEFLGAATLDELYWQLNRYHNRLAVFHFGGHSNHQLLALEDKGTRGGNLSTVLGMQEGLKLVFLNGCANAELVQELWDKGVKAIIATSAKVKDKAAVEFSRAFYHALKSGKTLRVAFDTACAHLSDQEEGRQRLGIYRTLVKGNKEKGGKFPWGLYVRKEDEALLSNWKLPDPFTPPEGLDYHTEVELGEFEVNKQLVEELFAGMAKVNAQCAREWEAYQSGGGVSFKNLQLAIWERLPSIVSGHIRDLFTPAEKEKGRRRLIYTNNIYLAFTQLMAALALADFWKTLVTQPNGAASIRPAYQEDLRALLEMKPGAFDSFDHLRLLSSIHYIKKDNNRLGSFPELESFTEQLHTDKAVFSAYRFLEGELRARLRAGNIASGEVSDLCQASEEHLGRLLGAGAFLANYQLASINDITVHNGLRSDGIAYVHWYSLTGWDDNSWLRESLRRGKFTCNHSVVLTSDLKDEQADIWVLSPFLVDKNAFNKKADVPKIYFWQGTREDGAPHYLLASTLTDPWPQPMKAADKDRAEEFRAVLQLLQYFRTDLKPYLRP
ncbi:MAG: CHAT domain-containing protein [Lewinellaceae bacterium]|nr:CHAT domain-containing protein [Phaeodactylibacter sp.]MCB0615674.1 CHAT domain-containing protein [Phaeodactylibacter sp.]MCB9352104.1 CHAT domain-containing protein [Lewinellaceae bacterium]